MSWVVAARSRREIVGALARSLSGSRGAVLQAKFEHRVAPQGVGIVAIRIGAGDLLEALTDEVA
jgi:hypothetical protein